MSQAQGSSPISCSWYSSGPGQGMTCWGHGPELTPGWQSSCPKAPVQRGCHCAPLQDNLLHFISYHQVAAPLLVLKPNTQIPLLTPPCPPLHFPALIVFYFLLAAAPLLCAPSLLTAHRVGTCAAHTSTCNVWPAALPEARIGSQCTAGSRGRC